MYIVIYLLWCGYPSIHWSAYTIFNLKDISLLYPYRESKQQIGDIMKMFTPYLKMYTEYVKHFDGALDLVAAWNAKHVEFSKMLRSLTPKVSSFILYIFH